jgi:hypothetical protein
LTVALHPSRRGIVSASGFFDLHRNLWRVVDVVNVDFELVDGVAD